MMMTSLESVCQLKSSLSPVQIQILVNSERVLQFVSDISHREVCVYVPGRKKGIWCLSHDGFLFRGIGSL